MFGAKSLQDDAEKFLQGIYRHFMLVELGVAVAKEKHEKRPFDVKAGDGPVYVETSVLADAICESLSSDHRTIREVAENAMLSCLKVASTIFGSAQKA